MAVVMVVFCILTGTLSLYGQTVFIESDQQ